MERFPEPSDFQKPLESERGRVQTVFPTIESDPLNPTELLALMLYQSKSRLASIFIIGNPELVVKNPIPEPPALDPIRRSFADIPLKPVGARNAISTKSPLVL